MRIGICKLGVSLLELDGIDKNGRYKEMMALERIFKSQGHETQLLDTVLLPYFDKFDKIFMLNGIAGNEAIKDIMDYRNKAHELNYIVTDLRLIGSLMSTLFDNVLTQAIKPIHWIKAPQSYNGMPELACYCYNYKETNKDIEFIFGGGVRDRREDFNNYFSKDDVTFRLLIKGPESDTRVPINEYYNLLSRSKYSLIINDKAYNDNGFITWRYFENISHDVITFLDHKVDKDNIIELPLIAKKGLTVFEYDDMKNKMRAIENVPELKEYILSEQRNLITNEMKTGEFTYKKLQREG